MKKYIMIGILIIIGLMATAPAGFGHSNIHAAPEIAGSNNTMVPGDAVYIMGYYAPYNLYVTAPTNISSPMITPFELAISGSAWIFECPNPAGAVAINPITINIPIIIYFFISFLLLHGCPSSVRISAQGTLPSSLTLSWQIFYSSWTQVLR